MNRMTVPPRIVWRKQHDTGKDTYDIVGFSGFEKRSMPTIVENDKGAKGKQGTSDPKKAHVQLLSAPINGFHAKAAPAGGASQEARLVACALALAEGHLAQAKTDPSATSDLVVNFTVHLGDKHLEKVDLIKDAIGKFYEAFAEKHSCTIGGTVQFTGIGAAAMPEGTKLEVNTSPASSPASGMGGRP